MERLTRRRVMQVGVAGAAGVTFGMPAFLRAQAKPVVMLGIWPFTGSFADVGPLLDRGMQLAIDEWGGQVLGKPIKYITRDDETKAGAATRRVEEAIDSEGAQFVVGPWSSGVALAVTEVAKRRKVLHYFSGGTEELAGKRCHRYGFQWAASPYTAMHVVMDKFMELNPQAKRWYLFVSDYAFGWSVEKYIKVAGQKYNIDFVGTDRVVLGTRAWSGFVAKALEGWETEDWPGKLRINSQTHQTERNYFFLRCKKPEDMKHPYDFADIVAIGATPLMPAEITECKDIGSL